MTGAAVVLLSSRMESGTLDQASATRLAANSRAGRRRTDDREATKPSAGVGRPMFLVVSGRGETVPSFEGAGPFGRTPSPHRIATGPLTLDPCAT